MGRDRNRENAMRLLSGALGAHFCFIFSLSFLTSIFHRFFLDFGEVSGGFLEPKMVLKSKILFFFLHMFVEILFLVEFCYIFDKIDG